MIDICLLCGWLINIFKFLVCVKINCYKILFFKSDWLRNDGIFEDKWGIVICE